ncbi:ribose-5-phosphate isomerase [Desulfobulbus propionicus DSM 2032]|jgi:ribose 5-phosphate isomerase B|uniref:Ribose-5-phosphate isomerase n=1 Tax=Desulfobulbus propionicus (strain ATCC 33891 / DSM 2032 / VKM B-1956 / 1pr3) TaxID=577650 RepID=A0A7U3YML5_DESPD|nr:ribose 5-phosphate isomerase B [Desulfobulbus propionicus]ADW18156.1 ribose-5-phosphate isomerase [Desulfobulbus propionicus DSM 2032]
MNIVLGCDHGGLELKQEIVSLLEQAGHTVNDVGCFSPESVDYPVFADKVCAAIKEGTSTRGILICGTGIGMSIAANRHRHIRAALCHEAVTARLSREHNDANVLCLGARVLGRSIALDIVKVWLETEFAGGRHLRRITMMG